jgi:uncharacterized protein (DUF305 family)
METTRKYGLLVAGILLLVGALLVGAAAVPALAQSNGNGSGGMMGGGMMGGGQVGMMGDVDRHFIEQMIPHHQTAIEMADLALQKAQRPEIKTLAENIKRTQSAEIDQMRAWYSDWYGTDVPTTSTSARRGGMMGSGMMGGGTMGGGSAGGCHGTGNVSDLENAGDFDRAFIEAMIPHHQMALMMTTMEQSAGQKSELRTLAQAMYTAQSAEIEQMRAWYQQWYGTTAPTN